MLVRGKCSRSSFAEIRRRGVGGYILGIYAALGCAEMLRYLGGVL